MTETSAELAELIGSRICHDLISPIGAINNGLELLELTGAQQGPELDLIADSVVNASARIRFFRITYGAAGDQSVGAAEISGILDDLGRGSRLRYDWRIQGAQPRALVRLAFLALQCCESTMPQGGEITVSQSDGQWTVTGSAGRFNPDPELWELVMGQRHDGDVAPAQVQFALLPLLAAEAGRHVLVEKDDCQISLQF